MFSFLKSESSKLRAAAKNWLYHAGKIYHFRKDKLTETELSTLLQLSKEVKAQMKDKSGSDERLEGSLKALRDHMEKVGGMYYPRSSMAENVEFFFAAAIIYVGFTTFFIKPFKIPTNSMWPTYHGMTGEVYTSPEEKPNAIQKGFRFVAFGASHYDVKAPASGEVLLPVWDRGNGLEPFQSPANVKRYFLINSPGVSQSFYVGDEKVDFKFPADFRLDMQVIPKLMAAGVPTPYDVFRKPFDRKQIIDERTEVITDGRGNRREVTIGLLRTGMTVEEGESILAFDLMTGDQLFVDRMSYHFVAPKVGDGFVFRTDKMDSISEEKFYIKRLVGAPGDTVKIVDGGLIVNGEPATGSIAFEKNAKKVEPYSGYSVGLGSNRIKVNLSTEQTVPADSYLAMGDNSPNSSDGRVFGYVPDAAVVGRPIMIYFPFTKRFGLAK